MSRNTPPTEDEQYATYKAIAEMMGEQPVVIRTLDVGGDKKPPCIDIPSEENPFLGWRAIRICLTEKELFKTQLKAIARASAHGNVRIMYPMITEISELRQANALLKECMDELKAERTGYDPELMTGIMVETPAAAASADILAKEAAFFSIGTNDLVQYVMAADRMNEKIAYLCEPLNPGVLRLIKQVLDVSAKTGTPACMCGEMAGNPHMTPLLVGLGLKEFSMNAASLPAVKNVVRNISFNDAEILAAEALTLDTAAEIEALLDRFAREKRLFDGG
jgi:phosphotransferase system enzyme I (PtsI)